MISSEEIKKSLLLANKYEKLKIYTAWKQFFILFGIADILTSLIVLFSYILKANFLITLLWILLPAFNLPLIFSGIVLLVLSNKYKLGKIGLLARVNNKKITSNKFYWQIVIFTMLLLGISFFLNFYTSTRFSNYIPAELFLASPFFITGTIILFLYVIQKSLYEELNFKELSIFGFTFILIFSPILFMIQYVLFQKVTNSIPLLSNLLDPNNNSKFLNFLLTNLFLLPVFFLSIFLILFGLYQYYKVRKNSVLVFTVIGILVFLYLFFYFLYELQTLSTIPPIVLEINQNVIQGLFTSISIIFLLAILFKGILLVGLGIIQVNKIENL